MNYLFYINRHSHILKNTFTAIYVLLYSQYMKKPQCRQRTACVMNISPVPLLPWLLSWGMKGLVLPHGWLDVDSPGWVADAIKPLLLRVLPCCFQKCCRANTLLTQPMKGQEAISPVYHFHSSWDSTKTHRSLSFPDLAWSLCQIWLQWDTDSVSVSWWLQLPKGLSVLSPRLKSSQWQVIFYLPHPLLYCPLLFFAHLWLDIEVQRWKENSSQG